MNEKITLDPFKPLNETNKLYVVSVISNPRRYRSRYDLYHKFERYVRNFPQVQLVTVEAAFGDREFECAVDPHNPFHVRLRSSSEVWLKEPMMNVGVQYLTRQVPDWKYVLFLDADVQFARQDWDHEIIQLLQHYDVVQPFSHAQDLSPDFVPFASYEGYYYRYYINGTPWVDNKGIPIMNPAASWIANNSYYDNGGHFNGAHHAHPGFGIAFSRRAFDKTGGLYCGILGSGDYTTIASFIGRASDTILKGVSKGLADDIMAYQERALILNKNVGYMSGIVNHFFHGKKVNRFYNSRSDILISSQFDPNKHLYWDSYGLPHVKENYIDLRDRIRHYFMARDEDNNKSI